MPTRVAEPQLPANCSSGKAQGFRRQDRLLKPEVVELLRDGVRLARAEFVIKLRENRRGHGRIAIAVPKRILKFAVDRNKVKRLIREEFRQHQVRTSPLDVLVTLRSQAISGVSDRRIKKHQSRRLRVTLMHLLMDVSRRFGALA